MALYSFVYVPHFLVKIPRIALTKVPPASACESVITKDPGGLWRGAGHAEGSLGAGGRAASPVPAGGRLVRYSLCIVLRQGAGQCRPLCARLPSPCAAEEPVRHVQAHGLAHRTSGCSARRGLEPSPPAFPAGPRPRGWWTGWSLSRLTPESRDWTRKQKSSSLQTPRSSSHLGPRGGRCPATPGCRWVGSLLPVHSTCPTPVSRGGPSSFVPACSLGHSPCENAPGPCPWTHPTEPKV